MYPKLKLWTRYALVATLLLLYCFDVSAQARVITGKVTDQTNGNPIAGATIAIKSSKQSTLTNERGEFSINVANKEDVLIISHVAFTKQEVRLTGESNVSISMSPVDKSMDDVVIIGYGTAKRSQVNGAVATIKGSQIEDIPAPNIAGSLRGQIVGLEVSAASGRPGAGITLNVRNSAASEQARLNGVTDEPLYVVDGITVTKDAFDNIDPSMVDELTVLKDASAAIYGAAGAKGVVLVTTKKGKAGVPTFSYNGYYGNSDATRKPETLSGYDHAMLLNESYMLNNAPASNFFSPADLDYIKSLNYQSWFDQIWKPAITQRHNINVSGGSEKVTFFAGGSYQNENGNYAAIKQDKFGFRSGVVANIGKNFKADVNFNVDHSIKNSNTPISNEDQQFIESIASVPKWVPMGVDGKWVNFNGTNKHPVAVTESGFYDRNKTSGYRINSSLTYSAPGALKGLVARLQVSQAGTSGERANYTPNYRVYNFVRAGNNGQLYTEELLPIVPPVTQNYVDALSADNRRFAPSMDRGNSYQGFVTIQYTKTFGLHDFNLIVGGEQSVNKSTSLSTRWSRQNIEGIDYSWNYDQSTVAANTNMGLSEGVKRSFFQRFAYNYADKYSLDFVTRFDASSNFAKGNIWGAFPSLGLGWVVSKERFFADHAPSFISYLKLRFSHGLTGDDRVAARLWQERFTVESSGFGYMYADAVQGGINTKLIPNPDITWEKKRATNFGVDISFFNDKLSLGADFFQNFTYDGFDKGADQNFPMYAGFASPVINYFQRYNWGSEFTIGYRANLTRDLSFNSNMNFSFGNSVISRTFFNRFQLSEVTYPDWQIGYGVDPRKYNSSNFGLKMLGMFRSQEEVDAFLAKNPGYTIDGKVPQPGWLYFEDTNGDGKITERDFAPMFNRTDPSLSTSINLGLSYKALSLRANIVAAFGGKVFYDSKARKAPTPTMNVPSFWKDHWTAENPDGKFPRFDDAAMTRGWASDFWAVDGTTIRVNNLTLSYRLSDNLVKRIGLNNVRILATGNNLWVLKNPLKYKDPYSSYIYDYPTIRTVSVGLSLGF